MIRDDLLYNLWVMERAYDRINMTFPRTPTHFSDDGKPRMTNKEFEESPHMKKFSQSYVDARFAFKVQESLGNCPSHKHWRRWDDNNVKERSR